MTMEHLRHSSTQTNPELHDVMYYKTRALNAERLLLEMRKDQYMDKLTQQMENFEKETTSKLHLYSYNLEKTRQLKLEFHEHTAYVEKLKAKANDIYHFNLKALDDGHELDELPAIDSVVDINTIVLGPVTPTLIPRSPKSLDKLMSHPPSQPSFTHQFHTNSFTPIGGGRSAKPTMSGNHPFVSGHPFGGVLSSGYQNHTPLFPAAPEPVPHPDDDNHMISKGEELLRMISNGGLPSPRDLHSASPGDSKPAILPQKPDIIPKSKPVLRESSATKKLDFSYPGTSMGLDAILPPGATALETEPSKPSPPMSLMPTKWSQIAAADTDDDWQAVGSRKSRTKSGTSSTSGQAAAPRPAEPVSQSPAPDHSDGANFERMVVMLQDKHKMTRPDVIKVLQLVREERQGDMGAPLADLMRDSERIIADKRSAVRPGSLTARAKAASDHEEPCDNQLCPARLKQLKYRTELCLSYQTTGTCHMKPGTCVYAHGQAQLRPLPKDELCERYLDGKCSNKKCVYAHGVSELRNRPSITAADYLKTKTKKHSVPAHQHRPFEDLSLNEGDTDPKGEECTICMEPMSRKSRRKLDCGHDLFHYKCLKKWVAQEGDRSCPLCRSNTLLLEEFPRLGS